MTPEQLKASILQYAIQGKLVEQRPEEGTAEDLYKTIQEEKQKLIKAGKIKKEKPLAEITEDEMPFDIPDSWKWVRIGDIYALTMGQSPDGNSVSKGTDGMEFHQGKVFFGKDYIQKSDQVTSEPSKIAEPNSVLLCVRAPVGIVNITDRELCIGRGLCAVKPLAGMTEKYALYSLRCLKEEFIKKATGTTFVAITGEVVKNQLIPLPPLAEQHRIVAKIEELLPLVDRYAASYEKLEQFNAKFPEDMKKSILQYAIQGKLVEQIDTELCCDIMSTYQGEASDLFDIPVNWKWVAIKDVATINTGLAFKKQDQKTSVDGTLRILRGGNIGDDYKYHLYDNDIYVDLSQFKDKYIPLQIGDVITPSVTSMEKMCKTGFIDVELENTTAGGFVYIIRSNNPSILDSKYLLYFISSSFNKEQCKPNIHKSGQAFYNLKKSGFVEQPICLPPIEEQYRIVAKIEELLPYCDRLVK